MDSYKYVINQVEVAEGLVQFTKTVSHNYGFTKSGRGTIKTKTTYLVYLIPSNRDQDLQDFYYGKSQRDAGKIFKLVSKLGVPLFNRVLVDAKDLTESFKSLSS